MSMKLWKACFLGISVMALGFQPGTSIAAEASTTQPVVLSAETEIMRVGGKTVTEEELTSYAAKLAELSGGFPMEGKMLLDDYILTALYDQIPTTATIQPEKDPGSATPYPSVAQRNVLKRQFQTQIMEKTEVPREEMEKWYEANKERYVRPERVKAWHIFMETGDDTPSSAPARVRQRLEGIKAQIDSGTSFSEAAQKFSEAASGQDGGEIGYISPRQPIGPLNKPMNPELEEVFFSLPPNQVSDVVETRHGMHLLYVTDKQTTRTPSVDDLLTSGILPGTLARDRATSRVRELVKETVAKYNGQVLPGFADTDTITTDTVVFEIDGRKMTLGDLSAIFGDRFTNYVETIRDNKPEFRKLMEQGLEDEAMVLAAVDAGIADDPAMKKQLEMLARKDKAQRHINAIVDAEVTVTDAQVLEKYHQLATQLRRPEADGYLVQVNVKQSTETAEQARQRDEALKVAQKLSEPMETASLADIIKHIQDNPSDLETTAIAVPRHVVGHATQTVAQEFDRTVSTIQGDTGVSQVVPLGNKMIISRVENRYPGDPVPLEEVRERIESMLEREQKAQLTGKLADRLLEKGLVDFLPGAAAYGITPPAASATTATDNATTAPGAQP